MELELDYGELRTSLDAFGSVLLSVERTLQHIDQAIDRGATQHELDALLDSGQELYVLLVEARTSVSHRIELLFDSNLSKKEQKLIERRKERFFRRAARARRKLADTIQKLNTVVDVV